MSDYENAIEINGLIKNTMVLPWTILVSTYPKAVSWVSSDRTVPVKPPPSVPY